MRLQSNYNLLNNWVGQMKKRIPVAGLGTRFLPATKSIPKELLPLVDKPLVQYAIEEAREAGIEDFLFISARGKSAMADYFDRYPSLENKMRREGKDNLLKKLKDSNIPSGSIAYLRQGKPLGLGHAVACARKFIAKDEYFAVILPDDVVHAKKGCLHQMVETWENTRGSYVGTMEVPLEKTVSYGVLNPQEDMGKLVRAAGLVEKPRPEDAPSQLAVIGRYILSPEIMQRLTDTEPGVGGEIQLTDAINAEAEDGNPVYGYRFDGKRYDCGSHQGFLEATVKFGLEREEFGAEFSAFLRRTEEELDANEESSPSANAS